MVLLHGSASRSIGERRFNATLAILDQFNGVDPEDGLGGFNLLEMDVVVVLDVPVDGCTGHDVCVGLGLD